MGRNGRKSFSSVAIALVHFYFLTSTNLNGSKTLWDDTITHRGVFKSSYFAPSNLTADITVTATCISSSTAVLTRKAFLRWRISYYSNSLATFNPKLLQIIRSDDIHPQCGKMFDKIDNKMFDMFKNHRSKSSKHNMHYLQVKVSHQMQRPVCREL